jgi:hypothetical protein
LTTRPPFQLCLALDYYDGPTSGLLFDRDRAYWFKMLAWDLELEQRVFAAGQVPLADAERVWKNFEQLSTPSRPSWSPQPRDRTDAGFKEVIEVVSHLASDARRSVDSWLFEAADLTGTMIRAIRLSAEVRPLVWKMMDSDEVLNVGSTSPVEVVLKHLASQ